MKPDSEISIRKVRVLCGRARQQAERMMLNENDLVIVRTKIDKGLPEYDLTKIHGSPIEFLRRHLS